MNIALAVSVSLLLPTIALGYREYRAASLRRHYWFGTKSGKRFYFFSTDIDAFEIDDICFSLSHIARFNGHSEHFYSVAQHLVLASELVDPRFAREAFCHDWPEAYVGDVVSPLKHWLPDFQKVEKNVTERMSRWLGIDLVHLPREVRDVDRLCYELEVASFSREPATPRTANHPRLPLKAWTPEEARRQFRRRYEELFGGTPFFDKHPLSD